MSCATEPFAVRDGPRDYWQRCGGRAALAAARLGFEVALWDSRRVQEEIRAVIAAELKVERVEREARKRRRRSAVA